VTGDLPEAAPATEKSSEPGRIISLVLVYFLAAIPFAVFLRLVSVRLTFAFDMEWIEGHMLAMATRVARGLDLYPAPSLEFVPAPYFPLYFVITGYLIKIFGPQFWVGRLVSTLATLGTCGLIYHAVRKKVGNGTIAIACASIFLASYGFTKAFYDLFRIDALAIFLLLLAFVVTDPDGSIKRAVLAGVVLTLATLTKQNALMFFPGIACVYFVKDWKKGLAFSAAYLLSVGLICLGINSATGGWFFRYTFELVGGKPMEERFLMIHVWIFQQYAVAIAIIFLAMAARLSQGRIRDFFSDKWLAFFAISYVVSFLFRLTGGGAGNALIPVCVAASVGAGTMLPDALSIFKTKPIHDRLSGKSVSINWIIACLLIAQLLAQGYWYDREFPGKGERRQAQALMKAIENLDGTYYMQAHVLPRDNTYWIHEMSWRDFDNSKWGRPLMQRVADEMRANPPDYLIQDDDHPFPRALRAFVDKEYERMQKLPRVNMLSATKSSPGYVYKRKGSAGNAEN
jgi:4-amino-4-deoxy-L-arabinose transferase-like glycosyltransferase